MSLEPKVNSSPLITIVIPTLNEVKNIENALNNIVNNGSIIKNSEVLVIDGGSSDGTLEIVSSFVNKLNLSILHFPGASVYKALNIGLQKAHGEYFIRVDARSEIPQNYLQEVIKGLQIPSVECVGGIQAQYGDSVVGNSIAWVTSSLLGTGGAKFRSGSASGFVDSVYLGAYRTAILRSLGGYEDEGNYISEDSYINKRIRESGKNIYLNASLRILYPAKSSFRQLIKQYLIYGAAKGFIIRKHKKFTSPRQIIPIFFLFCLICNVLGCLSGWIPWGLLGTFVGFYLLIVVLGNLVFSKQKKISAGVIRARCFATICIHFAWPIGFFLSIFSPSLHKRLILWL